MGYVTVFKRYELKYLITREQKARLLRDVEKYMRPDRYGRSTVRNVYFDTESYLLIRRSIEKPIYKEKLRIRSYMRAAPDTPVFVEIKKKYDSVVYASDHESNEVCLLTAVFRGGETLFGGEYGRMLSNLHNKPTTKLCQTAKGAKGEKVDKNPLTNGKGSAIICEHCTRGAETRPSDRPRAITKGHEKS